MTDPADPISAPPPASHAAGTYDAEPVRLRPARYEPPSVVARQAKQSSRLLLLVVRLLFLVMLVTVTMLTVAAKSDSSRPEEFELLTAGSLFIGSLTLGLIVVFVDLLTPHKRLSAVMAVYVGVCIALLGSVAVGVLIDVVANAWGLTDGATGVYISLAKVLVAIVLSYLAVSVVLTTKDDFRLIIPYVEFARQVRGVRPMVLDSSVLIDGRIAGVGETGFIDAPMIVPQFVIDELQTLADSADKMKRERGRRGLNILGELQASPYVDVSIDETEVEGRAVDAMLVEFASKQNLRIVTNDTNLSKVEQIRGVNVLNLNDLANTIKAQLIPGETVRVEIVKSGEGAGQGVGYLPDGTMVVVERAADRLGQLMDVLVTNSLQTSAGRMIFARPDGVNDRPTQTEIVQSMARAATSQPRTLARPPQREDPQPGRNPRR